MRVMGMMRVKQMVIYGDDGTSGEDASVNYILGSGRIVLLVIMAMA